jgi:hypothetical protein
VDNNSSGVEAKEEEVPSNPEEHPPLSEGSLPASETSSGTFPTENEPNHGEVSNDATSNYQQDETYAEANNVNPLPPKGSSRLRKAGAAVGGGALMTVGAAIMVTPLHPIGHAMFLGGGYIVGSEFEGARKLKNRIFRRGHGTPAVPADVAATTTPDTSDPSKEDVEVLSDMKGDAVLIKDSSSSDSMENSLLKSEKLELLNIETSLVELSNTANTEAVSNDARSQTFSSNEKR